MIPEDIVNNYNVTDKLCKDYLINHFNRLSLQHYKNNNSLLEEEKIKEALPNKILDYYASSKKTTTKTADKFWADDDQYLSTFKLFISEKYDVSAAPDTKFKDFLTSFSVYSGINMTCTWSSKYENLCNKLNIKFEKVVDPRFANKGTGTCYVFLKEKGKKILVTTNSIKYGVIPDLL